MELSSLSESVYRVCGSSTIPAVGLGTFRLSGQTGCEAIKFALKCGYRLLDTAHIYGTEGIVGRAVRECIADGTLSSRQDVFITSKLFGTFHQPSLIIGAIKHQVKILGLDYIDLYLIHTPWGYRNGNDSQSDYRINAATDQIGDIIFDDYSHVEMWQEMEKAVDIGLVKHIGLSNFDENQVDRILTNCRIRPYNNQVEIHPFLAQDALIDHHKRHTISITAFMPLGRINWTRDETGTNLFDNKTIRAIARKYCVTPAQILLRYQLERGVTVIPKRV